MHTLSIQKFHLVKSIIVECLFTYMWFNQRTDGSKEYTSMWLLYRAFITIWLLYRAIFYHYITNLAVVQGMQYHHITMWLLYRGSILPLYYHYITIWLLCRAVYYHYITMWLLLYKAHFTMWLLYSADPIPIHTPPNALQIDHRS
ncbi:hypothetical protein DPMN_041756 [Dreissena polymorpha]|uniref:Uncharacterized protein n=1 Tax=Dreissena polymorpha TaxID=45954 RepID=A0A9D4CZX1_DREPO|nr:hypothetical protein DPMN_041756 [Dreissena polymorpha]